MSNRMAVGVAAVGTLLAIGACGGGSGGPKVATLGDGTAVPTPSASASQDPDRALLEFARCMRSNGVDVPDPQEGPGLVRIDPKQDPTELDAAHKACRHHLAGVLRDGPGPAKPDPRMEERFLAFAKCMRGEGLDFPDPVFGADGRGDVRLGDPDQAKLDFEDPKFQAAEKKCRVLLPDGGAGPGDGLSVEVEGP